MFGGLENVISSLMFAVPAVKGIAFGEGFGVCNLKGSQNNDAFFIENGKIQTKTNHHGGILGGISSGMPITLQVALKPTPSIAQKQQTVNVQTNQNAELEIVGRHDACIVPRAVPCVESVLALAILDQMIGGKQL